MSETVSKTGITPTRADNYPGWYVRVVEAADLAEHAPTRGCMVIKPWGYAIWERMQAILDARFKATGHVNAYFPLLIPKHFLEQEAAHVEGFAKECAVVTHHRLKAEQGALIPDGPLEEPYVIRPTSETLIGACYARWVQSYRDLPILINQWANVLRWEMRTRLFLRTSEFLWQEGHTAHATAQEALTETHTMLQEYRAFAEQVMAMPVVVGEKTPNERFPGADNTYTIEAMMQDGKALQAGTSHFMGQRFAKASEIKFTNSEGQLEYAWTTSWGVSTRLIGGLIMSHSDDHGLVLPPALAPVQVRIVPMVRGQARDAEVLAYAQRLRDQLAALRDARGEPVRVDLDTRDRPSRDKKWQAIKQGVPLWVELGSRDVDQHQVCWGRRDQHPVQQSSDWDTFVADVPQVLQSIQSVLWQAASDRMQARTCVVLTLEALRERFQGASDMPYDKAPGMAWVPMHDSADLDASLKPLGLTARCVPLEAQADPGAHRCAFTGEPATQWVVVARAY